MNSIVNLTPQKYQLEINGEDWSTAWIEGNFSVSTFREGDGKLLLQGRIDVACETGQIRDLDPRTNRSLYPGVEVKIKTDSGDNIPLFGTLYIQSSQLISENKGDRNQITVGCWLSLLNAISGEDIAVCISDFDIGETAQFVVQELLTIAGIPVGNIDLTGLTGTVYELVQIDDNDSYINKAAEICYSNGFVLYQDRNGIVKVKNILERGSGVGFESFSNELLEYQQKNDTTSLPPNRINILGNRLWPIDSRRDTNSLSVETGEFSLVNTTYSKIHDSDNRIIVTTETIRQAIGNETTSFGNENEIRDTNKRIVTETFETKPIGSDCKSPDEGRMLKRVTSVYKPRALFLEPYYNEFAAYRNIDLPDVTGELSTWLSERTTETWEYNMPSNEIIKTEIFEDPSNTNLPEVFLQNSSQYFVRYTSTTTRPTAAIYPEIGNRKLNRDPSLESGELFTSYLASRVSEEKVIRWELNPDGSTWTKREQIRRPRILFQPEVVQRFKLLERDSNLGYTYDLTQVFSYATRLVVFRQTIEDNTNPSIPGRFPPNTTRGTTPYCISVKLPGPTNPLSGRAKSYTIPDTGDLNLAKQFANVSLYREWGRSNSYLISWDDSKIPLDMEPLGPIVAEESTGSRYVYEADGINLSITPKRAFYASVSPLIGLEGDDDVVREIWSRGFSEQSILNYQTRFRCSSVNQPISEREEVTFSTEFRCRVLEDLPFIEGIGDDSDPPNNPRLLVE